MPRSYSVQCCFAIYMSHTVTVQAEDLEAALQTATGQADSSDDWRGLDDSGPIFIVAACEGVTRDPGADPGRLAIPERFTEHGRPAIDDREPRPRPD